MKLLQRVINKWTKSNILVFKYLNKIFNKRIDLQYLYAIKQYIDSTISNNGIIFSAEDSTPMSRAERLITKEPDTIAWIDNYFKSGDIVYDVGANVGVYSLYSAKKIGCRVLSFEPEFQNYFTLNKNIHLNGLDRQITAYNIAINDENKISTLSLSSMKSGSSYHTFNAGKNEYKKNIFLQGSMGISLDTLVYAYKVDPPQHVKIDVDGNEDRVIKGMKRILNSNFLKTIAIELDQKNIYLMEIIKEAGFKRLTSEKYSNKDYIKKDQPYNYFFVRT